MRSRSGSPLAIDQTKMHDGKVAPTVPGFLSKVVTRLRPLTASVTIIGQLNAGGCPLITDLSPTPGEDWNDVLKASGEINCESDGSNRKVAKLFSRTP
jgi:hypothetical protein